MGPARRQRDPQQGDRQTAKEDPGQPPLRVYHVDSLHLAGPAREGGPTGSHVCIDGSGIRVYCLPAMFRYLRVLALVLGAAATILAPCMPALTWVAPCAMSGCDEDSGSRISAATCCCATTGTLSSTGTSTAATQGPIKLAHALAATAPAAATTATTLALAATAEPAVHVPIFLLNTSLLM